MTSEQDSPPAPLMEIIYQPSGRCFWHSGCAAQRHAPPMRIAQHEKGQRSLLECTACGKRGWYQVGWRGLARVPVEHGETKSAAEIGRDNRDE